MSYAKDLIPAAGVTTKNQAPQCLPGKRYQHPRNPWMDIKAWRDIYDSDIINKLVFGAYAIVLFLFGYIMQEYAKAGPLQYMTLYFPAAGCLWLAINSKKILQTSKNRAKTDVRNQA